MHLLVKQSEMQKIRLTATINLCVARLAIQVDDAIKHTFEVRKRFGSREQGQIPSRVVSYSRRIVEAVPVGEEGWFAVQMAQAPEFREPADVTNLPPKRIDYAKARPHKLVFAEVGNEFESALARFSERFKDLIS